MWTALGIRARAIALDVPHIQVGGYRLPRLNHSGT